VPNPEAVTKKQSRRRRDRSPNGESCLVMIYGPRLGSRFELKPGEYRIGRGRGNDVVVSLDDVSRHHCAVRVSAGGASVRDLGSMNGTWVNDRQLPPEEDVAIRSGDLLELGGSIFKYLEGGNVEALYHEEIYRTAIVDGLTRIHNHRYFVEFLERELARCGRHGRPLSLILFDVDHFKQINDRHGHVAGDHVLRDVAASVRGSVRREECFARYGGDEFVLVTPDTPIDGARSFAEKLRQLVEAREFEFDGRPIPVTISVGLATMRPGLDDPGAFIRAADDQLYEAKHAGRNCVRG
jgi:diguanylate cyclase (GGDEF)-like protein